MKYFFNYVLIMLFIFTTACTKDYGDKYFNELIKNASTEADVIDFSDCRNLKELPKDIKKLKHTLKITIQDDRFSELPEEMSQMKSLRWIEIRNKKIKNLPTDIGNLQHLEHLKLDLENLEEIPESLQKCKNIEAIYIRSKKIKKLPDIFDNFPMLSAVYIDLPELEELPESLKRLQNLKVLVLSMPKLKEFPKELLRNRLIFLYIRSDVMEQLPENLWSGLSGYLALITPNLKTWPAIKDEIKVREIYLHSDIATELPKNIDYLRDIDSFAVNMKNLKTIPAQFQNLNKITSAGLFNVKFNSSFEYVFNLPNLHSLALHNNQLNSTIIRVKNPQHIRKLSIVNNNITKLPDFLFQAASNIASLDLKDNKIAKIDPRVKKLTSLVTVDLSHNPLGQVPNNVLQLPKLQHVFLSNCAISLSEDYTFNAVSRLNELDLSKNDISILPISLLTSGKIIKLILNDNNIKVMPALTYGKLLPYEISLKHNAITDIPDDISESRLNIQGNNIRFFTEKLLQSEKRFSIIYGDNPLDETTQKVIRNDKRFVEHLGSRINSFAKVPQEKSYYYWIFFLNHSEITPENLDLYLDEYLWLINGEDFYYDK